MVHLARGQFHHRLVGQGGAALGDDDAVHDVRGQMVLDAGVSRIDPDDEGAAAELYPFVGFRVGLVFGR